MCTEISTAVFFLISFLVSLPVGYWAYKRRDKDELPQLKLNAAIVTWMVPMVSLTFLFRLIFFDSQ